MTTRHTAPSVAILRTWHVNEITLRCHLKGGTTFDRSRDPCLGYFLCLLYLHLCKPPPSSLVYYALLCAPWPYWLRTANIEPVKPCTRTTSHGIPWNLSSSCSYIIYRKQFIVSSIQIDQVFNNNNILYCLHSLE